MKKFEVHGKKRQKIKDQIINKGTEEFAESLLGRFHYEGTILNLGSDNRRLNPCPACGHNDCFTFNGAEGVFHCFSCLVSGSCVDMPMLFTENQSIATAVISEFTGIPIEPDPEAKAKQRKASLYADAAEIYHKQLMQNANALNFLTQARKRKPETITAMLTGFCGSWADVKNKLLNLGYTTEEAKSVFIPQGLFVYPYFSPYGEITRFNTKNYLHGKTRGPDGADTEIKGYSIGKKQLLFDPKDDYGESAVVVEGEQDFAALLEQGCKNVMATGGQPSEEQILSLRRFQTLYLLFDNDEGGRGFTEKVNEMLPDVEIYKIDVPMGYKDIDEYYVKFSQPLPFEDLLQSAKPLENDGCYCRVDQTQAILKNRNWQLSIEITRYEESKKRFRGNWKYIKNGKTEAIKSDVIFPDSIPKALLEQADKLDQALTEYYLSGFDRKSVSELESIYTISPYKTQIIRAAAQTLTALENKEKMDGQIASIRNHEFKSKLKQELIALKNETIASQAVHFQAMNPGQAFVMNTDQPIAYMYFNQTISSEDGTLTEEPCLLTSDRRVIHLRDYSRITSNQLLIIDGRFRIQNVIKGPLLDSEKVSLKIGYVKQYLNHEIDPAELVPEKIVRAFEELFKKVYYSQDPDLYKVLALYAFATYFSDLFGVMPYLYITAEKGSGKSTILSLLEKLCFNSIFVTDLTPASMIRVCNIGSTLIFDEFENRSSRSRNAEDDLIPLIKSGYSKNSGGAIRTNMEETYKVDCYSVYSPKIFAAIGAIDDVLQDRSICIILNKLPASEIRDTMDISVFFNTYSGELARLSSYSALSALEHFKIAYEKFNGITTDCESARSNQILKPLYTLSALVGEDYTAAIDQYAQKSTQAKGYTDSQSIEGITKDVLKLLAQTWFKQKDFNEYGNIPEVRYNRNTKRYTITESKMKFEGSVSMQVKYEDNFVIVNTAYLTLMSNSLYDHGTITLRQIHNTLPRVMADHSLGQRTTVHLKNADHIDFFKRETVSCYTIKINVNDYGFDKIQETMMIQCEKDLENLSETSDCDF